jgi:hypothetical protein
VGTFTSSIQISQNILMIKIDAATLAWANAVVTNGGSVSDVRLKVVDDLIAGLKSDGVWAKLDRLWLHAGENQASGLTDLVATSLATTVNSPAFTTDRGFQGDASTQYINTGFDPTVGTNTYLQNSAHFSAWAVTARSAGSGGLMGNDGSNTNAYFTYSGDGNIYGRINESGGTPAQGVPGTSTGLIMVNRSGASASQIYLNGSLFSSPNSASAARTAAAFAILAIDSTGTNKTNCQCAMSSAGGSLSSTDVTNFYNRLRTYMTAVGVP